MREPAVATSKTNVSFFFLNEKRELYWNHHLLEWSNMDDTILSLIEIIDLMSIIKIKEGFQLNLRHIVVVYDMEEKHCSLLAS